MSDFSEINRYQRALEAAERRGVQGVHGSVSSMLSFESSLETDYIEQRQVEGLPLLRFGVLMGALFYGLFFLIDALFCFRDQCINSFEG